MRCFICDAPVGDTNPFADLDEVDFDIVVAMHTLIHCQGPDDQFDADGNVVVCDDCIADAINPQH